MSGIKNQVVLILCELDVNHIPGDRDRILCQILVNKADEKLFLAESQLLVFWIGDIPIRTVAQVPWRGKTQMQQGDRDGGVASLNPISSIHY